MPNRYPVIILAGQNAELEEKKEIQKIHAWNSIFHEDYLSGNKPLNVIKPTKMTILEHVITSVQKSKYVSEITAIGQKALLEEKLRKFDLEILEQRNSRSENIAKGFQHYNNKNYHGKILYLAGDVAMIDEENIDSLIENVEQYGLDSTIGFGTTKRKKVREFLIKNHLEKYKLPNEKPTIFPGFNELNKFGLVLVDDKFDKDYKKDVLIAGNAVFVDTDRISAEEFEKLSNLMFSFKKGIIDPRNWSFFIKNFKLKDIYDFATGRKTITETENYLRSLGNKAFPYKSEEIITKLVEASPEFALDIDSQQDLDRADTYFQEFKE